MKILPVLSCLLLSFAIPAHAEVSPIHMDVEQTQKTEPKGKATTKGGPPPSEKVQSRSLAIRLLNNSNESFDGLVVKYWFFGHEMTGHEIKALKNGERKASLGPRGKETVESAPESSTYVEAHTEAGKGKGAKATKVPASGEKITGYAVQVLNGEKIMAEYYSEPSLKQKLAEPAKQPAEAAKPKAK